jgi:hypothetical protein
LLDLSASSLSTGFPFIGKEKSYAQKRSERRLHRNAHVRSDRHQETETATDAIVRESTAVVAGVVEHPNTATTIVVTIGALAFCLGYRMGRLSTANDYSYWRWELSGL